MFLICGEALYDLFTSTESNASDFHIDARIGGSPFNVAIGLSRLGSDVALFTGISNDPLGRRLERTLESEGVDTSFLVKKQNPTSLALVTLNDKGVPHYSFYGHEAAERSVFQSDLPSLPQSVTAIHFGSYSLVVEPSGSSMLRLARRYCDEKLIAYDPNLRLNIEPDLSRWHCRVEAFAKIADLIKVSDEDLELLFPRNQINSAIRRWGSYGVKLIVVTKGSGRIQVSFRGQMFEVSAQKVKVVDTVGAGDSFQAGLLYGLQQLGKATKTALADLSLDECRQIIDLAINAAAITCTRQGADLPRRSELPRFGQSDSN